MIPHSAGAGEINEVARDWPGFEVEAPPSLEFIAKAHQAIEQRRVVGRAVINL